MLGILIIVSIISISIAIMSYRYSVKKVEDTRRKMERSDLIEFERRD